MEFVQFVLLNNVFFQNEKPQYERIDYPNNSNGDISKSPSSHLDIPNSGNLKRTALILDTFNTYVILQVRNLLIFLKYVHMSCIYE